MGHCQIFRATKTPCECCSCGWLDPGAHSNLLGVCTLRAAGLSAKQPKAENQKLEFGLFSWSKVLRTGPRLLDSLLFSNVLIWGPPIGHKVLAKNQGKCSCWKTFQVCYFALKALKGLALIWYFCLFSASFWPEATQRPQEIWNMTKNLANSSALNAKLEFANLALHKSERPCQNMRFLFHASVWSDSTLRPKGLNQLLVRLLKVANHWSHESLRFWCKKEIIEIGCPTNADF